MSSPEPLHPRPMAPGTGPITAPHCFYSEHAFLKGGIIEIDGSLFA